MLDISDFGGVFRGIDVLSYDMINFILYYFTYEMKKIKVKLESDT